MDKSLMLSHLQEIAQKYRAMSTVAPELAPQYNEVADALDAAVHIITKGGEAY